MIPIHERIRSDIETKILHGKLKPGDRLPVERDLMSEYDCSRMTVNKAVSRLVATGFVERRRKAGSFVASPRAYAMVLDIPDLAREVRESGQTYRFRMIHREICNASKAQSALETDGEVLWIIGSHMADGVPFAYENRTVNLDAVPEIGDAVFDPDGPGTWLLENVPWTAAETRISATGASKDQARSLDVELNTPCLSVSRRTWRGGEHITAVQQLFPGDSYSLVARFGAEKT
ncbi:MAG: histidine utilization repressor [Hyphomonas sp.]|nr:histidine utilization repressor [Hyphomonas sp.]